MNILKILKSKYAVKCPKCNNELYFSSGSAKGDTLGCKVCNEYFTFKRLKYFKYKINFKKYESNNDEVRIIKDLLEKGLYKEFVNKTSDFYSPEWLKWLIKKFKK
jgi:hypothetical protein